MIAANSLYSIMTMIASSAVIVSAIVSVISPAALSASALFIASNARGIRYASGVMDDTMLRGCVDA